MSGYEIVSVSEQVVNGYIYVITLRNREGDSITYTVYVALGGDISVQNVKTVKALQTV